MHRRNEATVKRNIIKYSTEYNDTAIELEFDFKFSSGSLLQVSLLLLSRIKDAIDNKHM